MSKSNGTGLTDGQKRGTDTPLGGDEKRAKSELATSIPDDDPSLGGMFDPLPFETKSEMGGINSSLDHDSGLDLPDFLSDKPLSQFSHTNPNSNSNLNLNPDLNSNRNSEASQLKQGNSYNNQSTSHEQYNYSNSNSSLITSGPHHQQGPQSSGRLDQHNNRLPPSTQARSLPNVPRINSSPKLNDPASLGGTVPAPNGLYHSQSTLSLNNSTQYQRPGINNSTMVRPGASAVSPYKAQMRIDPTKSYPGPQGLPTTQSNYSYPMAQSVSNTNAASAAADKTKVEDPTKLNDALAAAGVDIQREEELLSSNYTRLPLNPLQQQMVQRQRQGYGQSTPFLQPYHLAVFMNRVGRENGMVQNFMLDTEMLELMSSACKDWISNLVTKTVTISRHRRRGIPALSSTNGSGGAGARQKVVPANQRSEISKDLRELALRQKALEERRVEKRALLGLERSGEVAPETGAKDGNDETLHRAANATAAMMTMNPGRKKYSWMTSGAAGGGADDAKAAVGGKENGAKQSALILARGDNGLRFREIRTGNMITTKDLLSVLEDERMGVSKAIVKGYARLKD